MSQTRRPPPFDPPRENGPPGQTTESEAEEPQQEDWRPEAAEAWERAAATARARALESEREEPDEDPDEPVAESGRRSRSTGSTRSGSPYRSRSSSRSRSSRSRSSSKSRSSSIGSSRRRRRSPRLGRGGRSRRLSRRRPHSRHRGLKITLLIFGFILLGAGAVLADAYYQAYKIASPLEDIAGHLNKARSALSRGKLPAGDPLAEATRLAEQAQTDIENARFTYRLVGGLSGLGRPMDIIHQQALAAGEWAQAATIIRDMVVDLLGDQASVQGDLRRLENRSEPTPLLHDGVVDVELVRSLAPRLQEAIAHLEAADRAIKAMPDVPFPPRVADVKERALAESAETLKAARDAMSGLTLLPSFLGSGEPKTYYIALQNPADQRATGGAVLAYAIVQIDNGRVVLEEAGPIHDIDDKDSGIRGVDYPPAVAWYLNTTGVRPRLPNGANYSPNFPVVASTWAAMVEEQTGRRIHGVIALDPTAVAYALGDNNQIQVPSYPEKITGDNVVEIITNDQFRLDKELQQAFTGELINKAWPRLSDPRPLVKKVQQLGVGLREKHIQIWSRDPAQQALIRDLNWDGGLEAGTGDYLFLAHNKRNGGKTDYYLEQEIRYDVTLGPSGDATSEYSVTLRGDVPPGEPVSIVGHNAYGLNVAMDSLYVPKRASFTSVEPTGEITFKTQPDDFVSHEEGNFLVLTRPVEVFPDDPQTIIFRYDLPDVVKRTEAGNVYELRIQHQPMVNPATFVVNVTLPKGAEVQPSAGWSVKGNVATYDGTLTTDRILTLVF